LIVFDDWDRVALLSKVEEMVEKHRLLVVAWCLMDNHIHLVARAPEGGLSQGMQELLGGYARGRNRRYGRTGHLFHNRFYDREIQTESHMLEACRYVVLNPVRAGACRRPEEWAWSSYRASAGLELAPRWLDLADLLPFFGERPAIAQRRYRQFVSEGHAPVSDTGARDNGAWDNGAWGSAPWEIETREIRPWLRD
jgi:REP element-mobilizing transposase RayT